MGPEDQERRKTDRRRVDRRRGERREGERREGDRRREWQQDQAENTMAAWAALKAERKAEQEPKGGLFRRRRQS